MSGVHPRVHPLALSVPLSVPAGSIEKMEQHPRPEERNAARRESTAHLGAAAGPPEPAALWVDLLTRLHPSLDTEQAADLWEKSLDRESEWGTAWAPEENETFTAWCHDRARAWPEHGDALLALAASPPVDARVARALTGVMKTGQRATTTLAAQASMVAGLQHVDVDVAVERIEALRCQYATSLALLPDAERPDPPAQWVHGFTCCDFVARKAPSDPATLYAIYRAQCDPEVFTEPERNDEAEYAVVDLETASPQGGAWFEPSNGHIIEVGVVVTDVDGSATQEYEQLLRPTQAFLDAHGTGAVDIHRIGVDALDDAPSWDEKASEVLDVLDGRVLVAQHVDYEMTWLSHHFAAAGLAWNPAAAPVVDTLRLAQQHFPDIDNHRLATVCETLGIEYTDGHRALHDAQVTARALVALREHTQARYAENPRFAGLPVPV